MATPQISTGLYLDKRRKKKDTLRFDELKVNTEV
jgi:hypothetical protein